MFGYIRIFTIASLISVTVISALIGLYFRSQSTADIRAIAEMRNTVIVQGFTFSVWKEQRINVLPAMSQPNKQALKAAIAGLHTYANNYMRSAKIERFALHAANGDTLFASDGYVSQPTAAVLAATREITEKRLASLSKRVKEAGKVWMVTHVPLYNSEGLEALVEVATDVTTQWNRMVIMQWVVSGSLITVCTILIWILIVTSKKAEAIIEQQHEANIQLEASAAAAQAETEQKSMFLANISHELRTPLNAIIGFSDILRVDPKIIEGDSRNVAYLADINQAGVHLLSLINDILDFSKAEAGKLEMEVAEVNASKLVSNCLRLVLPRAEASGVTLEDATPKESLILTTDNKKLKQILLNLLSNAVKFTPSGGRVRVSAWRDLNNDCVGFEVRDTGIGIAAKDISKALMPFGQVDNAISRKYEGTGLGLPLTKKFVELMGGTFKIESEPDQGTTVTFLLPTSFVAQSGVNVKMVG